MDPPHGMSSARRADFSTFLTILHEYSANCPRRLRLKNLSSVPFVRLDYLFSHPSFAKSGRVDKPGYGSKNTIDFRFLYDPTEMKGAIFDGSFNLFR
jgi:hypothetical protein